MPQCHASSAARRPTSLICHAISSCVTLCHAMSRYVTLCHAVSRCVTLCHAMSRYVTLSHAKSRCSLVKSLRSGIALWCCAWLRLRLRLESFVWCLGSFPRVQKVRRPS